jgi:hypothetical protein
VSIKGLLKIEVVGFILYESLLPHNSGSALKLLYPIYNIMSDSEIKLITVSPYQGATGLLDTEEEHALYSEPVEDEEETFGDDPALLTACTTTETTAETTATATDVSGAVPEPIVQTPPVPVVMPAPDMNTKGVVGLQNMGNTCYANSTIQLLRAVPEWNVFCMREDLESACTNKESINAKLIMGYQDLIQSMWSAHRPAYVRPMGFLGVIRDAVNDYVEEYREAHPVFRRTKLGT